MPSKASSIVDRVLFGLEETDVDARADSVTSAITATETSPGLSEYKLAFNVTTDNDLPSRQLKRPHPIINLL